ncbi:MAG: AAA family ATPase [Deltaproteobacteria bacterium]|nr:AAA family ATPase [Deltaproteobacteria bacterium]MBW2696631.1 AAA family ATPase [Deltaproteobacteria bacterium]
MSECQPLPEGCVEALSQPGGHPHDPAATPVIDYIQTHISHLFLTRDRVYKLRKAVELPFLSFATTARRNADCLREVELNRRLAPDVYLGVAPIQQSADGFVLGRVQEALQGAKGAAAFEHCVVMRRLPRDDDALHRLEDGRLEPDQIDALAELLADFHAGHSLGRPAPWPEDEWLERVARPVRDTIALARSSSNDAIEPDILAHCERRMKDILESNRACFLARREAGRVVDGHGDLHLDHVWFEPGRATPIAIDCIEFDDDLRHVDVAAELAFLVMDLAYRGRPDLAERVLRRYAAATDDFALYGVVDYHVAHRALVRASVASIATDEKEIAAEQRTAAATSARRHAQLAADWLDRRPRPLLIVMAGRVGSGKSTVADELADQLEGVVIASDRVRKHMAGMSWHDHVKAAPGEGLYDDTQLDAVYGALLERAAYVIGSGRAAILDATFSRRTWRAGVERWAMEHRVPIHLVEARCHEAETLARLARRNQDPERISDAGPELYAESLRRWEPLDDWKPEHRSEIWTDRDDWRDSLRAVCAQLDEGGVAA